jgi:hypothetical protein
MRTLIATILTCTLLLLSSGAFALSITDAELSGLSWTITSDPTTDTAGTTAYKTYGAGTAISNGFLYVVVQTNFPQGGAMGNDSYTSMTHFSSGDLYLNVGGTFQSHTGSVYGIATTSHANVVQQAYAGQTWTSVTAGNLYSNAVFATGTYEQYQLSISGEAPDDGDGNNRVNSYPTLIKTGNLVAGDVSGVRYTAAAAAKEWDYEIFYKVSLASLGLDAGETVQAFWVMECGNDGAQAFATNKAVPEPSTIALITAGVAALAARRRNII